MKWLSEYSDGEQRHQYASLLSDIVDLEEVFRFDHTVVVYFFFQAEDGIRDLTVTGVQTCALPIFEHMFRRDGLDAIRSLLCIASAADAGHERREHHQGCPREPHRPKCALTARTPSDRKSTRLNSSHSQISYAVFCLKKKKRPTSHR